MNCFPCFSAQKTKKESSSKKDHDYSFHPQPHPQPTAHGTDDKEAPSVVPADYDSASSIKAFNFRELLSATKNFRQEFLLGEGSHGKVYKGTLQGKDVAVKQLDRNAMEGNNEFFVEVGNLSLLQHSNLVSLIGYCNDGDQRLLVYEFMSGGSLEDLLHGEKAGGEPLDWATRMKIAHGAAEGLQYLHEKAKPPVLYRDLQSSKILLDDELHPKLANVGLDRLGSSTDSKMPMQSTMDNTGYNAPELTNSGTITAKTDVYSFGVILLELITGRKPLDLSQPQDQQSLVDWAQPIFKEPKHFPDMADPLLKKKFPERGLNQAVAIAAMCVQEEANARPMISDLASVLGFLSIAKEENNIPETLPASISSKLHCISDKLQFLDSNSGKLKAKESNANEDDGESDDEDEDDEDGSTSGNSDEETEHQPNNGDENGNENHSVSEKSSENEANSVSRKISNKTASYSSCDYGGDDGSKLAAAASSSVDLSDAEADADADADADAADDASVASSNYKTKKKSVDECDDNKGENETLRKRTTSKKMSEKTKSRKSGTKKKKNKDESSKSGTKKSNDESNSSSTVKKTRRKAKKRSDKDEDLAGDQSQADN